MFLNSKQVALKSNVCVVAFNLKQNYDVLQIIVTLDDGKNYSKIWLGNFHSV